MEKKYQVFVSSTFRDLVDERQDTIRSILDLGHIPAGMELFPAADTEQLTYIKKVIDECDYYVLIMGGRYGSLDPEGISFTEREYDYAVENGKVVLAFPHGDLASIPVGKSETAERMRTNLSEFRAKVMAGRLVREWTTREQLESLVVKALVHATSHHPAIGWIRGNAAASEDLLREINNLRVENQDLKQRNDKLKQSITPKLPNLASGDEIYNPRFTYNTSGPRPHKKECKIQFTWNEIFIAIASKISPPKSTTLISSFLRRHLEENRGESITYYLLDSDAAIIKNQLVALGLIEAYVGKSIRDGASHEFMKMTAFGKMKLAELLAIKSTASD